MALTGAPVYRPGSDGDPEPADGASSVDGAVFGGRRLRAASSAGGGTAPRAALRALRAAAASSIGRGRWASGLPFGVSGVTVPGRAGIWLEDRRRAGFGRAAFRVRFVAGRVASGRVAVALEVGAAFDHVVGGAEGARRPVACCSCVTKAAKYSCSACSASVIADLRFRLLQRLDLSGVELHRLRRRCSRAAFLTALRSRLRRAAKTASSSGSSRAPSGTPFCSPPLSFVVGSSEYFLATFFQLVRRVVFFERRLRFFGFASVFVDDQADVARFRCVNWVAFAAS